MRMMLAAIAMTVASPALAHSATPADAHAQHGTATHAQHTGHGGHDMGGCCEKDAKGKMACCEKMKDNDKEMTCCEKPATRSPAADPHAGNDMSKH